MNYSLPQLPVEFYSAASPIFVLAIGSLIAMLQSVIGGFSRPLAVKSVLHVTLILATVLGLLDLGQIDVAYLEGTFLSESLARFGSILVLLIALVVSMLFSSTFLATNFFRGEIASMYLMVVMGTLVMMSADELITLFVGLEMSSIGLYALIGYVQPSRRSMEGAVKYLVLGAFATGMLLYGFALLYAGTGSMRISEIVVAMAKVGDHPWVKVGGLFTLVGLGFKLALAPFHLWAPDAYEGAPTGLTAYMATAVKVMILIVTLRFMAEGMNHLNAVWMPGLIFLAIASMILGNVMALVQSSLKRMLAYSSIAHSGYMVVAICAIGFHSGQLPVAAVLFYIVGYTVITLGTFGVLMWLESEEADNLQLDDIAGLAKKHPWACAAMATFMFSYAGFPPTVGFISKFFVFNAALTSELYSLVIIGVIGSMISVFYYLRVIMKMYMAERVPSAATFLPNRSILVCGITGLALILTFAFGMFLPDSFMISMKETSQSVITR